MPYNILDTKPVVNIGRLRGGCTECDWSTSARRGLIGIGVQDMGLSIPRGIVYHSRGIDLIVSLVMDDLLTSGAG